MLSIFCSICGLEIFCCFTHYA